MRVTVPLRPRSQRPERSAPRPGTWLSQPSPNWPDATVALALVEGPVTSSGEAGFAFESKCHSWRALPGWPGHGGAISWAGLEAAVAPAITARTIVIRLIVVFIIRRLSVSIRRLFPGRMSFRLLRIAHGEPVRAQNIVIEDVDESVAVHVRNRR